MTLTDALERDYIKVPLQARTKNAIIEELVEVLIKNRPTYNHEEILSAVLAREVLGSTGLADGVAIPHAKTAAVDKIALVMGITPEPIDFKAQDGKGSQLFLVLAPEKESSAYIELLASIARATSSSVVRRLMVKAHTPDEVLQLLLD
jgi:mannitol/fructose-specific phosphotransferase system IIA component (Ntr-type)